MKLKELFSQEKLKHEPINTWKVKSKTDPNKEYEVELWADNKWVCTCWGFIRNKNCKHIKEKQYELHTTR